MTHPPYSRPSDTVEFANIKARQRQLSRPRNPRWLYLTPIAPAGTPDDYVSGDPLYSALVAPWENFGTDDDGNVYPPSAYRRFEGKTQIRLALRAVDADMLTLTDSLITTLPDPTFWPKHRYLKDVVVGFDGSGTGTIAFNPDGTLVFIRQSNVINGGTA